MTQKTKEKGDGEEMGIVQDRDNETKWNKEFSPES